MGAGRFWLVHWLAPCTVTVLLFISLSVYPALASVFVLIISLWPATATAYSQTCSRQQCNSTSSTNSNSSRYFEATATAYSDSSSLALGVFRPPGWLAPFLTGRFVTICCSVHLIFAFCVALRSPSVFGLHSIVTSVSSYQYCIMQIQHTRMYIQAAIRIMNVIIVISIMRITACMHDVDITLMLRHAIDILMC